MRDMSVLEALQETVADLEASILFTDDRNTRDTMQAAVDTINGALELLGAASNVRPSTRRPRTTATKPKRKRKKSAYQIWAEKERPKIVKQHPRFDFGRVQKELGIRWRRKQRKGGKK